MNIDDKVTLLKDKLEILISNKAEEYFENNEDDYRDEVSSFNSANRDIGLSCSFDDLEESTQENIIEKVKEELVCDMTDLLGEEIAKLIMKIGGQDDK